MKVFQELARPRAVILGADHPRAVAIIRSLGRAGINVDAVDSRRSPVGFYSRYLRNRVSISSDGNRALQFLEALGRDGGGILIPTNDYYVVFAAKNFDRLSKFFTVTVPPWIILEKLMDRPQCYRLASDAGIKTPRFFAPRNVEEMKKIAAGLDFEHHGYVLKMKLWAGPADMRTRRFSKDGGPDAASLQDKCLEIFSRTGEFPLIEEILPGDADSCIGVSMVVNRDCEPVAWYCVRRLKLFSYSRRRGVHPYELGTNVYCESTYDDEAVEAAKRFARQAKFYGMMTIEFRRHATDGSLYLIKAEPRPVKSTSLSTALGMDLPVALYQAFTPYHAGSPAGDGGEECVSWVAKRAPSGRGTGFTGSHVNSPRPYPDGIAWIWLTWYLSAIWRNRLDRPVRKELVSVLRKFGRIRAFAYLSVRDPAPCCIDVVRQRPWWMRVRGVIRVGAKLLVRRSPS